MDCVAPSAADSVFQAPFLFPALRLKDSVYAAAAPFPHKVPGLCGDPGVRIPPHFLSLHKIATRCRVAILCGGDGGIASPQAPLTPSSKLFFSFPLFALERLRLRRCGSFSPQSPGTLRGPRSSNPPLLFYTTKNDPERSRFLLAEMGGFAACCAPFKSSSVACMLTARAQLFAISATNPPPENLLDAETLSSSNPPSFSFITQNRNPLLGCDFVWRRWGDSNSRNHGVVYAISSRAPSTS